MQLVAMLTMLVDHVGMMFFPGDDAWRIVGRIAMPLYAFGVVQGFKYTRNRERYFNRLLWLSAISQIPFMLGLRVFEINIVGNFAVCLAVLIGLDRTSNKALKAAIVAAAGVFLEILPFDYGSYALLLILMYRYAMQSKWTRLHAVLNLVFMFVHGWLLQVFSVFSTVLLTLWPKFKGINVPRWLWRSFYPAHLSLIAGLVALKSILY